MLEQFERHAYCEADMYMTEYRHWPIIGAMVAGGILLGPLACRADVLTVDQAVSWAMTYGWSARAVISESDVKAAEAQLATPVMRPQLFLLSSFPDAQGDFRMQIGVELNLWDGVLGGVGRRVADAQSRVLAQQTLGALAKMRREVKHAYYAAQAAEQVVRLHGVAHEADSAAAQLALRQYDAGNISESEWRAHQAIAQTSEIRFLESRYEASVARDRLGLMMGRRVTLDWELPDLQPVGDGPAFAMVELQQQAVSQRWEMQALRADRDAIGQGWPLREWEGFHDLAIGVEWERELDGRTSLAPTLTLPLPLFGRGYWQNRWQEAALMAVKFRLAAMEDQIRFEIKIAYEAMQKAGTVTGLYRDQILPNLARILDLTQKQYNFMLTGVYGLIQAKQNELTAQTDYVHALQQYVSALADLEWASGEPITMPSREVGSP